MARSTVIVRVTYLWVLVSILGQGFFSKVMGGDVGAIFSLGGYEISNVRRKWEILEFGLMDSDHWIGLSGSLFSSFKTSSKYLLTYSGETQGGWEQRCHNYDFWCLFPISIVFVPWAKVMKEEGGLLGPHLYFRLMYCPWSQIRTPETFKGEGEEYELLSEYNFGFGKGNVTDLELGFRLYVITLKVGYIKFSVPEMQFTPLREYEEIYLPKQKFNQLYVGVSCDLRFILPRCWVDDRRVYKEQSFCSPPPFICRFVDKMTIEKEWRAALSINTISVYRKFLLGLGSVPYYGDVAKRAKLVTLANRKIDSLTYAQASFLNIITAYQAYIDKFPSGMYITNAKMAIEVLEWNKACSTATFAAYEEYLKKYPSGEFIELAKGKLDSLLWERTKKINTVSAYINYCEQFPEGRFASIASKRFAEFEENDWRKTKSLNTAKAYQDYLDRYPEPYARYRPEAKKRFVEIAHRPFIGTIGTAFLSLGRTSKYPVSHSFTKISFGVGAKISGIVGQRPYGVAVQLKEHPNKIFIVDYTTAFQSGLIEYDDKEGEYRRCDCLGWKVRILWESMEELGGTEEYQTFSLNVLGK